MKIIKRLRNFGEFVYEIECNYCLRHFYYDKNRSLGSVKCLGCSNIERWEVIEKEFIEDSSET